MTNQTSLSRLEISIRHFNNAFECNRLAKQKCQQNDYPAQKLHYGKKRFELVCAAYYGIEFQVASDNPSLLSFRCGRKRLHWLRDSRLIFATYEHEYQAVSYQLCEAIESAKQQSVSATQLHRIRNSLSLLPEGNILPVLNALERAQIAAEQSHSGAAQYELCRARGLYLRVVKSAFPTVASRQEQEAVDFQLRIAIRSCIRGTFERQTFIRLWKSIDMTCLTTSRIVRDLWWLQDASVAINKNGNVPLAIKKLLTIHSDLCPNMTPPTMSHPEGPSGTGMPAPSDPQAPQPGVSLLRGKRASSSSNTARYRDDRPNQRNETGLIQFSV